MVIISTKNSPSYERTPLLPHRLLPSHLLDPILAGSMATSAWVESKVPAGWCWLSVSPSPDCRGAGCSTTGPVQLRTAAATLVVLTCEPGLTNHQLTWPVVSGIISHCFNCCRPHRLQQRGNISPLRILMWHGCVPSAASHMRERRGKEERQERMRGKKKIA